MKFMQRAAASPVSSPATLAEPSPKRRRTGDHSPVPFDVAALADQHAVQLALADEESKRQAALDRQAADAGDTRWVLKFKSDQDTTGSSSVPTLHVVQAGFATIDRGVPAASSLTNSYEEGADRPAVVGRRSFGKFNRVIEV
jgi:hypothetical protein